MKKVLNKFSTSIKKRPILSVVLLFVILVVALLLLQIKPNNNTQPTSSNTSTPQPASKVAKIKITKNGFEPSTVTIDKGTNVIWVNDDSGIHQVMADSHPDHKSIPTLHSELLNQDQTYEFTPDNSGQIDYHDETSPSHSGTIIVN